MIFNILTINIAYKNKLLLHIEMSNLTQPNDPMIYTGLKFSTPAPKETKSFLAQHDGLGHILFSLLIPPLTITF
jgi:hypothetical protein